MDTLILGLTYIRRCVLEQPHFLNFREVVSVHDDDNSHLAEVHIFSYLVKEIFHEGKRKAVLRFPDDKRSRF
jgi:hypothetical protein